MAKTKKHPNKNYTAVLLEEVRSNVKLIAENLDHVRKKGDATFEIVGELQEDMIIVKTNIAVLKVDVGVLKKDVSVLKDDVSILKKDVSVLKVDVSVLKKDVTEVKEELHIVRNELKEKVGRDEFKLLENRVARLEKTRIT